MAEILIENIVLNDKDEITPVKVDFTGAVSAIVINHGDHAYAKVRYDPKTLDCFSKKLHEVKEKLISTRSDGVLPCDRIAVISIQLWVFIASDETASEE
jgi:hypothetical protein